MTKHEILVEFAKERFENPESQWSKFFKDIGNIAKSKTIFDPAKFENFTKEEIKAKLKRKWKTQIWKLGAFVESYKHLTVNYLEKSSKGWLKRPTILHLSTTSRNMLAIFGTKQEVSRVYKTAQDIGLLVKTSDTYRFNTKRNFSKEYAYNKHAEKEILKLVKEAKAEQEVIKAAKRSSSISLGNTFTERPESELYKSFKPTIKFNSKLWLPGILEDWEVSKALQEKYKAALDLILPKIEKLNNHYIASGAPERCIKFTPTIKRSKNYIKKIGIRATSKIVSLKEHENGNDDYTGKWRWEYLAETGFDKSSYDVHGSIFQTAHLLFTGEPVTNKVDPYKITFGYKDEQERKWLKSLAMPTYFDRPNSIINHNRGRIEECLKKYEKWGLQPVINDVCDRVYAYTGPSLDSEIFFWESILYILLVEKLLAKDIECVQVYDGFYFNKQVPEEVVEQEMQQASKEVLAVYHQVTHSQKASGNQPAKPSSSSRQQPTMKKTMKKHIKTPDNDIPDDDIPLESHLDASRKHIDELQSLVNRYIISKMDASRLCLKLYGTTYAFKEASRGWSIEDRLKAKRRRFSLITQLASKYPSKITAKDIKSFI